MRVYYYVFSNVVTYVLQEASTYTRIDIHDWRAGTVETVCVHRAEYRHWDA